MFFSTSTSSAATSRILGIDAARQVPGILEHDGTPLVAHELRVRGRLFDESPRRSEVPRNTAMPPCG